MRRRRPPEPAAAAPRVSGLRRFGGLSFAYFAAIGLFNPYAPLWFQSLGLSTLVIGAISSLQSWTRIVAPYAWSWWGDHSGRRAELIRLAAAGACCRRWACWACTGAAPVALVTALLFIANSGVVPLSEATAGAPAEHAAGHGHHPLRPGAHVGLHWLHCLGHGIWRAAAMGWASPSSRPLWRP
jgi:MFS family permease